jgi:surface polysaccharide O-acyltransferase-like enzyme
MNNKNPFAHYVIFTHIAFTVAVPLIFFIGGGVWLAERMGWADWTKLVFILIGIASMLVSLITYIVKLVKMYGESDEKQAVKPNKKDSDYFYENDI